MPGATPQSVIAITLFFFAKSSSSKGSSEKKEISTIFFPISITSFKVLKPM